MQTVGFSLPYDELVGAAIAQANDGSIYSFGGAARMGGASGSWEVKPDIFLVLPFGDSGTIASAVLASGSGATLFDRLEWSGEVPAGTDITFDVRVSHAAFAANDSEPAWVTLPEDGRSLEIGLVGGFLQWRAHLTSQTPTLSPSLESVAVFCYDGG